jgi:thioredoxin 1
MTNNDKVPELNGSEFDSFVKEGIVLIDFFADWCMPCVMMSPIIDELAEELKGKVKFGKVNIEDNGEIAQKFDVVSIPNFILFKDGKQVEQFAGSTSGDEFKEKLEKFL